MTAPVPKKKALDEAINILKRVSTTKDEDLLYYKNVQDGFSGSGTKEKYIKRKENIDKAIKVLEENNKE